MVANASQNRPRNRGVLRVDLPWMDVEDGRVPFSGPASEQGFGQGERVESQVPSSSERDSERAEGPDRHRDLPDFSVSIGIHSAGMIAEFRPSVTVVPYGKHAAAVGISFVQENLVGPGCFFQDRKRRRTVSRDGGSDDIFQCFLRFPDVLPKRFRRHFRNHRMVKPVRSDLVSRLRNLFDQCGMIPRDPAKNEKRTPDVIPVEKFQQSCGIFFNTRWEFVPILFREQFRKRLDLEIFLDIYGESVRNRSWTFVFQNDRVVIRRQGGYRAPRPRRTILMVWNRIRRSSLSDMFLM